ncbi:class I SAM-dependent methyltransferase [Gammaproteobacteria bacterium]|nr:class I SAM-dependent methyltransferase [Gammaproteobacteria bacterium]MDB3877834.1 class I SAM-dependent methyltransferase [Gammaproteobacteria bacterium]MDB4243415.1 class I SAM-dependent methyltransferase [Gammaproteobacteria bacterium]MDB9907635.1 class I SAM-dependent methyltransferase [Gammaproteobacteria bacterium]MDC0090990.1 class I SAM-dependent methyltransferase [Gammaproteobacteria bacterium]
MVTKLFYTSEIYKDKAKDLAKFLGMSASNEPIKKDQAYLELGELGLSFFHPDARAKNALNLDFQSGSSGWRLKRADHEKLIKKALGKSDKPLKILDCTAGLLQDSLLFLTLGHHVTAIEQSKIVFLLLQDAIARASRSNKGIFANLKLLQGNAVGYAQEASAFDVIYFDPMYPPSKKTALGSGQLEYLSKILETESMTNDPQEDFEVLQLIPVKKMIVKRPIKAEAFASGINYQVSGKTTRYDVYI